MVSIRSAGVNYPDALLVQGKYQYRPETPFLLGSELAGVVKEIGAGVTGFTVGQRVYGSQVQGAFAEEIVVASDRLRPIPEAMSFDEAAALSIAYNTSYYGLVTLAGVRAGETVLVLGAAGGVGLAAIEIAKAKGARVIAAASSAEKLAVCTSAGADELINYSSGNLRDNIKAITGRSGVDVVYDPVGGAYAEPSLRSMAWRGRYLVVGFAAGEIPRIPLNLVLLKGCSILGLFLGECWNREPNTARQILEGVSLLIETRKIHPHVSARYPLTRVADALNALLARQATGKIVLIP